MLEDFFDTEQAPESFFFQECEFPWQGLVNLKARMKQLLNEKGHRVPEALPDSVVIKGLVHIEDGAQIDENTYIQGPTFIGSGAEVRFGAYIRGNVYVGAKAVVGHDTEVKHSILLPGAKAAHFAYVGDSILGREVNLGAGTKCANVRVDMGKNNLMLRIAGERYDSGIRKFGAIMGNGASVGCNTVTNPGTLLGRDVLAYPLANLAGYIAPRSIVKVRQQQQVIPRLSAPSASS
jgi:bifunctional UDP-N-acetylglucosamine pyrophosphorylase / glucosamine-1-phosphate N-acetyltransferase